MEEKKKDRKVRSDKGKILATQRDFMVLPFIADQYAVRLDHVRVLLSRFPGKPLAHELVSKSVLEDQIDRWRAAGWVEYERFLAEGPGWVWITKVGLEMLGLDSQYSVHRPAASLLRHYHAVNTVRLKVDLKFPWHSERELMSEHPHKKGLSFGPVPDGWVDYPLKEGSARVAVEVEISQKKQHELNLKVGRLAASGIYKHTWFYVPSVKLLKAVEVAMERLTEYDKARISVVQFSFE